MRHLLVPAHIKWEDTLKNYQRERETEHMRQDKIKWEKVGGIYSLTQRRNHRRAKQERRIRISKKGIHPCVVMFDHVSER